MTWRRKGNRSNHPILDLTGKTFGYLTAVRVAPKEGQKTRWVCKCICNKMVTRYQWRLRRKRNHSCGCKVIPGRPIHGLSKRPEYIVWAGMRNRCKRDKHYTERGIAVCKRWNDFAKFFADLGPRPSSTHSLERKNNNKGYSPSNCVWCASWETQQANTTRSVHVILNGEKVSAAEAARRLKMKYPTVTGRYNRYGWSIERAFDYRVQAVSK